MQTINPIIPIAGVPKIRFELVKKVPPNPQDPLPRLQVQAVSIGTVTDLSDGRNVDPRSRGPRTPWEGFINAILLTPHVINYIWSDIINYDRHSQLYTITSQLRSITCNYGMSLHSYIT